MSNLRWLVALLLTAVASSLVQAEPHCPGGVTSLPLRLVQRSQLVMSVSINHHGPYDFLVDTGAQVTTVDPSLAAELNLKAQETAGVTGVSVYARTPLTRLASVEAGPYAVSNVPAVIQNLGELRSADHRVRGVLGGNFLEHFDLFVDYGRPMLCLDDALRLRASVKGQHIPLSGLAASRQGSGGGQKLILAVHLSGMEKQVLLQLDSGTNAPLLFDAGNELRHFQNAGTTLRSRGTDGKEHAFAVLAGQDVRVGPHVLRQVQFVAPVDSGTTTAKADVDGLLPAALFQRVFVDYAEHYVVLEPW